jgi:hypothetical protein
MPCGWLGRAPKAALESAVMVGPIAEKIAGSGGTAVLATPICEPTNSGGGVGWKASTGGAGLGAGAGAACSLAPQPRQNL